MILVLRALCLAIAFASPALLPLHAEAVAPTQPSAPQTDAINPDEARMDALIAALDLEGVIAVMRDEGNRHGAELAADLFPEADAAKWAAEVARVYDVAAMREVFVANLRRELPAGGLGPMVGFFGAELGQRVIALELSARRALLDPAVEEVANQARDALLAEDAPRMAMLRSFAEAGDLIDSNVAGAMNANLAFVSAMVEGGAFAVEMTEQQIVSDVWSQEPEIRQETEDWLYAYLGMAYQPLSDADLAAYIAFSVSREGKTLNRALFAAFDGMFTGISRALGRAAAGFISGQDI